jgi:hypothetical protein
MMAGRPDDQQTPRPEGKGGVFPCTLMQERLWSQVRSGRPYGLNVAMRWLVTGRLTRDVAQRALQGLVDRHEILRTCLREVDGVPKQVILPACPIKLRSIDLTALDADAAMARAEEIAREEAGELMDLGEAPLFRAGLLRLASDRSMLLLTFHATVADGWSIGLLISEFQAAVKAIEAGSAPDTSEPELQVADYALWERELVASGALEEQRQYWQRKLRGVAGTTVPGDHERAERRGSRSEVVSTLLPSGLSAAIDGFASRHGFTLYGLAVSALALLLHRVTGEAKIVVGSQVAHREEPIAETLAGPTVNSITLCLPVDDHATLLTFARMTADEVQEALHHQELPFEVAVPAGTATRLHAINVVVQRSYSSTLNAAPAVLLRRRPVGPQLLPGLARRRLAHVMRRRHRPLRRSDRDGAAGRLADVPRGPGDLARPAAGRLPGDRRHSHARENQTERGAIDRGQRARRTSRAHCPP